MATNQPVARVSAIQGKVFAKGEDGAMRQLNVGDPVFEGEILVALPGSQVELATEDGRQLALRENEVLTLDAEVVGDAKADAADSALRAVGDDTNRIIQAINEGGNLDELLEETAAGEAAGGSDGGSTFVRLLRITEGVDPLNYEFETARTSVVDELLNGGAVIAPGTDRTPASEDGAPSVSIPDTNGAAAGDTTLPETAGATAGSFTISTPGGLQSINVGGTSVSEAQLGNLGSSPVTIDTGEGTLILTGFDPASGTVSYTYDPNVLTHTGSAPITDSVTISVTDDLGNTSAPDTLDIVVTDSLPVAQNDAAGVSEDGTLIASGSVLTGVGADSVGADENATPVTAFSGDLDYGTLVLNSDGSYSYTLNNTHPAVNGLNDGQTLTDSYTYTLTDGDGSSTTATLTITINGTNDAPVLDLDGSVAGFNYTTSFIEAGAHVAGTGAIAVVDTDHTISDVDSSNIVSATITLTNAQIGDVLAAGSLPTGITATVVGNVVTLTGSATLANYQTALSTITFNNTSETPNTTPRSITVVVNDGTSNSNTATTTIDITASNDAPVANNDFGAVGEDGVSRLPTTLTVTAANGVIQSAAAPSGTDTDPESLALTVTAIRTGTETGSGTNGTIGTALAGIYGTLTLNADGSYTYALNNSSAAVQNLLAGEVVQDVFTYTVSDGSLTDLATLTINVTGAMDLTALPPELTPLTGSATGLNGEYYGYNDTVRTSGDGFRRHADDGKATFGVHSGAGNLNSVEDMYAIMNGRNAAGGGSANLVGTSASAASNVADVSFKARTLDYGFNPEVNNALGNNAAVNAGVALPAGGALSNFLDQDRPTAVVQTGASNVGADSGLGRTSDAAARLSGKFYVPPGFYDFRVTADDGFRLNVAGKTLVEFDGNQSPTTRVFSNLVLGDVAGGLQDIELLYWEQDGNARLKIEYKSSSDSNWQVMSLSNTAMFTNEGAPVLTDLRIQDLVYDGATATWQMRTGALLEGDGNANTLTGGAGRDWLSGGGGNDILHGNAGSDMLDGGAGNDILNGGAGGDLLIGGAGADTLTGGAGDDIYRLSDTLDTIMENAGEGSDTVELDATYVAANTSTNYTLAANLEHLTAYDGGAINLTGNAAANRIIGNSSDNTINGGDGNDYLVGGQGNDTLIGGAGSDIFAWRLADHGSNGSPNIDTINDFNYGGGYSNVTGSGGDVLDLRDLLQGEHTSSGNAGSGFASVQIQTSSLDSLLNYIDVSVSAGTTTLRISSTGGFTGGTYEGSAEDQRIVLQGVDLYGVTSTTNETDLLKTLIKNGTLIVD